MKKGVMRPGHVQIRVLDLDEALGHYRDLLGLIEVSRDEDFAYLKAWTETDDYSVILRKADSAGMDFMGFKVLDEGVLEGLCQNLIDYGIEIEHIAADDLPNCGRRVRFTAPTGHSFELYASKGQSGKWGIADRNPEAWPRDLKGMKATRFDHCLLYGDDIDGVLNLFVDVLGFDLAEQVVDPDNNKIGIFLTCSMKAHDIAFIKHPEKDKFHHASFFLNTWEDVLRAADLISCLLYTSPSPRDRTRSRMPSSA